MSRLAEIKDAGADMIGVAIDAATPELFEHYRSKGVGGPHRWEHYWATAEESARVLGHDNVGVLLFDVIGDTETIQQVLHLDRSPDDYAETLTMLRELEIPIAPHVIVGLHFGQLRGELAALEMIHHVGAQVVVIVVLHPLPHTPMADLPVVELATVGRLAAVARLLNPTVPLTLGCVRPVGPAKIEMERWAVLSGVNSVAYPDPATVRLADELGLRTSFTESCCTLIVKRR